MASREITKAEIETMARHLCQCDGNDPEAPVLHRSPMYARGYIQNYRILDPATLSIPAWKAYTEMALAALKFRRE